MPPVHHSPDTSPRSEGRAARPSVLLELQRQRLREIVEKHGGRDAMVFGSVARGDDTIDSDIDLLVTLPETADLIDVLHLADELEAAAGARFDIASGRSVGPVTEHARAEAVPL